MVNLYRNGRGTNTVPQPVKGRTVKALQRAMFLLNQKYLGTVFYIGAPQWVDKEGAWVAWYYVEITTEEQLGGVLDGDN